MRPALAAAALAAAALATPAAATNAIGNEFAWTVTTSGNHTLAHRLDAACVFAPDRLTADYGVTYVESVATSSGAGWIRVRCDLYFRGEHWGEVTNDTAGPVHSASGVLGAVGSRAYVTICAGAEAAFPGGYVVAPTVCKPA